MAILNEPIRVGVVGCGNVAEMRHLPALLKLREVQVAAVADMDPHRLTRIRTRFKIRDLHRDYRVLLDDSTIDAVAICVPAQHHAEVAIAALDAGKHVFIEKPLALSLDEADQLMQTAKNLSKQVTVGFNMRWHRLVRQAKKMIQQETLGPIKCIVTRLTSGSRYSQHSPEWKKYREQGGGALIELAVHHFDLWRFLLQSEVEEVFAASCPGDWEDETATVTARMESGTLVVSFFSEVTHASQDLEIYGQRGYLKVSCYRFDGLNFIPSSRLSGDFLNRMENTISLISGAPRLFLNYFSGGDYVATYEKEWQHFIGAIRNHTPLETTLEDGRRALQIVLASLASTSMKEPVKIERAPRNITPVARTG
jgi:predicted dehydrogenase